MGRMRGNGYILCESSRKLFFFLCFLRSFAANLLSQSEGRAAQSISAKMKDSLDEIKNSEDGKDRKMMGRIRQERGFVHVYRYFLCSLRSFAVNLLNMNITLLDFNVHFFKTEANSIN